MSAYNGKVVRSDADTLDILTGGAIKANGTQAAAITDLTTSASGTEIATAVNAIIAALVGVGILAEDES